jgi:hypothetical protein
VRIGRASEAAIAYLLIAAGAVFSFGITASAGPAAPGSAAVSLLSWLTMAGAIEAITAHRLFLRVLPFAACAAGLTSVVGAWIVTPVLAVAAGIYFTASAVAWWTARTGHRRAFGYARRACPGVPECAALRPGDGAR